MPCGRAVWWSLRELNDAQPDQLAAEDSAEAYLAVARELSYDVLGSGDMDAIEKFRETPGTLQDQTWTSVQWSIPKKETDPCWWLMNAAEEDLSLIHI